MEVIRTAVAITGSRDFGNTQNNCYSVRTKSTKLPIEEVLRCGLTSAPNKLNLCAMVNDDGRKSKTCKMKHKMKWPAIPLICKQSYVGQMGRCICVRLQKHANSLKANDGSQLCTVASASVKQNLIGIILFDDMLTNAHVKSMKLFSSVREATNVQANRRCYCIKMELGMF